MAQVIGVFLRKSKAIYGRNGVYVYSVEIADNDPTAYVAEIYQSQCGTYWTMAILNRNIELVYRNHFMEKKTAIRFLKKHFDTNEYVAKIQ
jgi:hypothetical protein